MMLFYFRRCRKDSCGELWCHRVRTAASGLHRKELRHAPPSPELSASSPGTCASAESGWKVGDEPVQSSKVTWQRHLRANENVEIWMVMREMTEWRPCPSTTGQPAVVQLLDWTCRGVAQVMFVNNPLSGLLVTAGLFLQDPWWALSGLLATFVSTASAFLLGQNRSDCMSLSF